MAQTEVMKRSMSGWREGPICGCAHLSIAAWVSLARPPFCPCLMHTQNRSQICLYKGLALGTSDLQTPNGDPGISGAGRSAKVKARPDPGEWRPISILIAAQQAAILRDVADQGHEEYVSVRQLGALETLCTYTQI
jgi:hypothetical protein